MTCRGHYPRRPAQIVTEVLSPAAVVVVLPLAVAWQTTGLSLPATPGLGVLVAVFHSAAPMAFLVRGARRGRWDGRWVRDRAHRTVPLLVRLASALAGTVVMLVGGAPRALAALAWALIAPAACMVVTALVEGVRAHDRGSGGGGDGGAAVRTVGAAARPRWWRWCAGPAWRGRRHGWHRSRRAPYWVR